ncbi:hypothetical protein CXG81DRAFT_17878 [Caulochytrium protostelioides]|uniref:LIM zinc-binding domain-containing protein n=1 Tax=Caulochytrium protostelioides TaxID=1555241 RepID=A0A4V1IV10_9FUNG|nr:hypothetical protein CXG81DRAFT_17878 [Caulochytrium protostelioides]|eukprot:RKP02429.1 hypothetical protein CXG81DRAFT_17878 [Caulochytrium protostelioides]
MSAPGSVVPPPPPPMAAAVKAGHAPRPSPSPASVSAPAAAANQTSGAADGATLSSDDIDALFDSTLTQLTEDLAHVHEPSYQGMCTACALPIHDRVHMSYPASDSVAPRTLRRHTACFRCDTCRTPLAADQPFFPMTAATASTATASTATTATATEATEAAAAAITASTLSLAAAAAAKTSRIACAACYRATMLPRCAACQQPLELEMAADGTSAATTTAWTLGDAAYHPACLTCHDCRGRLEGAIHTTPDEPEVKRCLACVTARMPRCHGCTEPMAPDAASGTVTALHWQDRAYHPACFGCHHCATPLPDQRAHNWQGQPTCPTCVATLRGAAAAAAAATAAASAPAPVPPPSAS